MLRVRSLVALTLVLIAGCGNSSRGGGATSIAAATSATPASTSSGTTPALANVPGNGPRVVYDATLVIGDPAPSPFPNDTWTKADSTTVTGRRLALPMIPQTKLEKQLGEGINDLDGFGTYAPVMITFDGPIDLATVTSAAVKIVNVDPKHPHFGRSVALDLSPTQPVFPVTQKNPYAYFSSLEPNATATDIMFRPGNRVPFYEDETNTLILRPIMPLDEAAEHAVIITTALKGANGDSVRAPTSGILPGQNASVFRALNAGAAPGGTVSFAFTFTTQSITATPLALSDGLHGKGPFASLATAYPPRFSVIDDFKLGLNDKDPYTLDVDFLRSLIGIAHPIGAALGPSTKPGTTLNSIATIVGSGLYDFDSVKYIVTGKYKSPSFVKGGGVRFDVSVVRGTAKQVPDDVTFLLCVPKPCAANAYRQPPYPVVIFGHGNDQSRIDALGMATELARAGWATITIDAYGHGPENGLTHLVPNLVDFANKSSTNRLIAAGAMTGVAALTGATINPLDPIDQVAKQLFSQGIFKPFMSDGRAIDVDGDGIPDSGQNFFNADPTVTRDITRQTALDTVQLCRIIKACGTDVDKNGTLDRAEGDFHQAGVSDIGGPNNPIYYVGQSLGSIVGGSLVAIAPEIEAAVLNAAGGGLNDVNMRGSFHSVTDRLMRICWGTVVSGKLDPATGETVVQLQTEGTYPAVGRVKITPNSRVTLTNVTASAYAGTSVAFTTSADASGQFFAVVKSDRDDVLDLEVIDWTGATKTLSFRSPTLPIIGGGMGVLRNTPQWRRYLGVGALALDGGDPVNFARYWREPLKGQTPKRVLIQLNRNDWTVPVGSGINLARAAGFITHTRDELLRQIGVPYGKVPATTNVDRDYPVESTHDYGVRFFCADKHEFINVPNTSIPDGYLYTVAAQKQVVEFLRSGSIDDSFPILRR